MPPSLERPLSPKAENMMHMEHLDRLPSPKRETRTPPKSRPVREEDVLSMLERVQMDVVAHAKKEVARQVEVTNNNMQAKLEGQVFASKDVKTYTAPDGEVFSEEQKYKKYMYQNFYSFKDKEGEKCVKVSGDIRGNSFDLCNLKNCEVRLLDHIGQVFADDLVDCKVYIGACGSDVFVRNCRNCTFTIACKQLRLRDCSHSTIYLYSATRPALESSHHMELAPFNGSYPRQAVHFKQAGLNPEFNKWDQVHDFSNRVAEIPKPHWTKQEETKWEKWEIPLEGVAAKPENPVKRQSNALWFTQGSAAAPIMGIKGAKAKPKKKGLFAKIGPKLG